MKSSQTSTSTCAASRATSAMETQPDSFGLLDEYAIERLALFLAKRHKTKRGYGYWRIARSPDRMGLIRITGTVVAPQTQSGLGRVAECRGEERR